jgi:hypothetical protein
MENFKTKMRRSGMAFVKVSLMCIVAFALHSCGKKDEDEKQPSCNTNYSSQLSAVVWKSSAGNGDAIVFKAAQNTSGEYGTYTATSPDLGCSGTYSTYRDSDGTTNPRCGITTITLTPNVCSVSNICSSCGFTNIVLKNVSITDYNL